MHSSAYTKMQRCIDHFLTKDRRYRVVDIGSRISDTQTLKHKDLFASYDIDYVGVDVKDGANVDVVLEKFYTLPFENDSADLVISGQVFEHVPYFWISFLEIARILKTDGLLFVTVPSRGHIHDRPFDGWRFYPDSMKSLAAFSQLRLLRAKTDFPPTLPGTRQLDYSQAPNYWGDTLGVFQKPANYDQSLVETFRSALVAWGDSVGDVDGALAKHQPAPADVAAVG